LRRKLGETQNWSEKNPDVLGGVGKGSVTETGGTTQSLREDTAGASTRADRRNEKKGGGIQPEEKEFGEKITRTSSVGGIQSPKNVMITFLGTRKVLPDGTTRKSKTEEVILGQSQGVKRRRRWVAHVVRKKRRAQNQVFKWCVRRQIGLVAEKKQHRFWTTASHFGERRGALPWGGKARIDGTNKGL